VALLDGMVVDYLRIELFFVVGNTFEELENTHSQNANYSTISSSSQPLIVLFYLLLSFDEFESYT
jgi:hypothetical protein